MHNTTYYNYTKKYITIKDNNPGIPKIETIPTVMKLIGTKILIEDTNKLNPYNITNATTIFFKTFTIFFIIIGSLNPFYDKKKDLF